MGDSGKTKARLLEEMSELRRRVVVLELERAATREQPPSAVNRTLRRELEKRKRAEEALHASERQCQALVEAMPDLMFRVSHDGTVLDSVPSREGDLLTLPEEWLGKCVDEVLPKDVARVCMENVATALRTGAPQTCEFRLSRDGETRDYEARIVVCGENEVVAIVRDITSRKMTEGRLRDAEQRYHMLFSQSPDAIVIVDPNTMLPIEFNDVALRLLGYTREEFARVPFSEHEILESPEEIKVHIERIVRDGVDEFDTKLRTKDGRIREVLADVQAIEISGRIVFHSVLRDITERKRSEERLRESEQRFRGAFDHAAAGMVLVDPKWKFLRVNQAFCRMLGYKSRELRRKTFQDVTHPEDLEESVASVRGLLAGDVPVLTMEKRYLHKDGSVRWGLTTVSLVRDADDEPLYFVAETQDITERKATEEALRRSEEHLRLALRSARVGTWEWDIASNEVFWSEGVEDIFGLPKGSFAGSYEAYLDLIYPEDRSAVEDRIARALEEEAPYAVEHRILWPDGSVRWLAGDGQVIRDESGRAVRMAGTVMDITERKLAATSARRLQNKLTHVARVSAMGEMAAGLAHELNQPLTVISGYARTCMERIQSGREDPKELVGPLETVAQETERAGEIIRRLWNLIRSGEAKRTTVHVNDLIREIAELVESEARQHEVVLKLDLTDSPRSVEADGIQIQQVILNLVRNACEAMAEIEPERRRLTVETSPRGTDAMCISVRDAGPGVSFEALPRIFEPFFSTKSDGLGMGLTISRSIIDAHGGHLSAGSNADGGTTFEVTLPAAHL